MKKILLPLLAAGVCASASAVTADDLVGKTASIVFQGNDLQHSFPCAAMGGTVEKYSNGVVRINNFYDTLGSNFKVASDGKMTFLMFTGGKESWSGMDLYGVFSECREMQFEYKYDGETAVLVCWQYGMEDEEWPPVMFNDYKNGMYGASYNYRANEAALLLEYISADYQLYDIACFNGFSLYVFDTNATATEYQGNMASDMYNVDVVIDDSKTEDNITIKNFLNQGMSYSIDTNSFKYGVNWVTGTLDKENGTVYFPIQDIAGDIDFGFIGDGSDYDTFLGDGYFFSDGPEGYWFVYDGVGIYPWQLIDASSFTGDSAYGVEGTYSQGKGTHTGTTKWVSNGGDCKTTISNIIDLGSTGIYGSYYGDVIASADRIVIEGKTESTASVEMKIARASYWEEYGEASGFITASANTEAVDHFDIYAVEGNYSSIYDGNFRDDAEKGHVNAFLVHDGSKENELNYAFQDTFMRTIGKTNDGAKNFTFFVKTNYKPETGLAPTFHAMTTYSAENAAEEIAAAESARINAANGMITILGSDEEVSVYNAAGAVVYQGYDREIPVAAGVYVVRLGETVKKVVL